VAQKRLDGKIWYFGPKTSSKHTTKWAPLGPLKPSIYKTGRKTGGAKPSSKAGAAAASGDSLRDKPHAGQKSAQEEASEIWLESVQPMLERLLKRAADKKDLDASSQLRNLAQQEHRSSVAHGQNVLNDCTKRTGRPSVDDPCTPRAERPPRQPHTLSVAVVG
jgi:hypothetical protein